MIEPYKVNFKKQDTKIKIKKKIMIKHFNQNFKIHNINNHKSSTQLVKPIMIKHFHLNFNRQ
jgi:hypothetical protein